MFLKMTKNSEKWAFSHIFNVEFWKDHKSYGLEGFSRVKHISWAAFHANMVAISMKSRNPPGHLADTCFLSHFWGYFYIEGSKSGIFGQQMLTKISENVFHTLNSSHLKYHVNTTNRSWKNLFFTPLAHKVPLENLTFIYKHVYPHQFFRCYLYSYIKIQFFR